MGGDSQAGRPVQGSRLAWTPNHKAALKPRQSSAIKWAGINTGWLDRGNWGHVYWRVRMSDVGKIQGHLVDEWRMARTERFRGNTQREPGDRDNETEHPMKCLPCSSDYFVYSLYFIRLFYTKTKITA